MNRDRENGHAIMKNNLASNRLKATRSQEGIHDRDVQISLSAELDLRNHGILYRDCEGLLPRLVTVLSGISANTMREFDFLSNFTPLTHGLLPRKSLKLSTNLT